MKDLACDHDGGTPGLCDACVELITRVAVQEAVRQARAAGMREGFEIAANWAEVSEWDGWHVTSPRVDMDFARRKLDEELAK